MKEVVKMDSSGRLVLPKRIRRQLHTHDSASFEVEVLGNRLELTLVDQKVSQLRKKGRLLVVPKTGKPFDAVAAIDEVRRSRS